MRKRMICVLVLLFLLVLLAACRNTPEDSPKSAVELPARVLALAGKDAAGMCENFEDLADKNKLYCEASEAGNGSVVITILESEREAWKNAILASLHEMLGEMSTDDDQACRVEVAEDYRSISSYIHQNESSLNIAYYVLMPELDCAYLQLFSGVEPEKWYVEVNIYNADTGKLVVRGNSNENLSITESDWEASK